MHNPFQELADRLTSIETLLVDLRQSARTLQPPLETELLDVAQAADFLRLTKQTVYDKVHAETLPFVKRGNRIYFFKDELILWLRAGRQPTGEQREEQAGQLMATHRVSRRRKAN